jgi:hypothetical protein
LGAEAGHVWIASVLWRTHKRESPAADLAAAEKLIHACGYHRRDEEFADARQAIFGPSLWSEETGLRRASKWA